MWSENADPPRRSLDFRSRRFERNEKIVGQQTRYHSPIRTAQSLKKKHHRRLILHDQREPTVPLPPPAPADGSPVAGRWPSVSRGCGAQATWRGGVGCLTCARMRLRLPAASACVRRHSGGAVRPRPLVLLRARRCGMSTNPGRPAEQAANDAMLGETWTMTDIVVQATIGCAAVSVGMLFGLVVRGTIEEYQHTKTHGSAKEREQHLDRIHQKLQRLEDRSKGAVSPPAPPPLPPPGLGTLSSCGGVSRQLVERACKISNRVLGVAAPVVIAAIDPARQANAVAPAQVAVPTGGEEGWELHVLTPLDLHPSQSGAEALGDLLGPLGGTEGQSLVGGLRSGVWAAVVVRQRKSAAYAALEKRVAAAEAALAARDRVAGTVAASTPARPQTDSPAGEGWEGIVVFTSGPGMLSSGLGLRAEAHSPLGSSSSAMTALLRYCATLAVAMDCGWLEWAEAEPNTARAQAVAGFGPLGLGSEEAVSLGRGKGTTVTRWRLNTRMCKALSCVDPAAARAVPVSDDFTHKYDANSSV